MTGGDCRVRGGERNYARRMTLRMHPVSAARWAQLAAARNQIDLTPETPRPRAGKGNRRAEHAAIQAQVAAIADGRVSARR
jgi:hypothetical protein